MRPFHTLLLLTAGSRCCCFFAVQLALALAAHTLLLPPTFRAYSTCLPSARLSLRRVLQPHLCVPNMLGGTRGEHSRFRADTAADIPQAVRRHRRGPAKPAACALVNAFSAARAAPYRPTTLLLPTLPRSGCAALLLLSHTIRTHAFMAATFIDSVWFVKTLDYPLLLTDTVVYSWLVSDHTSYRHHSCGAAAAHARSLPAAAPPTAAPPAHRYTRLLHAHARACGYALPHLAAPAATTRAALRLRARLFLHRAGVHTTVLAATRTPAAKPRTLLDTAHAHRRARTMPFRCRLGCMGRFVHTLRMRRCTFVGSMTPPAHTPLPYLTLPPTSHS